jgi:hypothetical protein
MLLKVIEIVVPNLFITGSAHVSSFGRIGGNVINMLQKCMM